MNDLEVDFESEKFRQINECQKILLLRTIHTGFENPWHQYAFLKLNNQFYLMENFNEKIFCSILQRTWA